MKCSSRRNCDFAGLTGPDLCTGLNEVQLPKELRPPDAPVPGPLHVASMKCSSRRNRDLGPISGRGAWPLVSQ